MSDKPQTELDLGKLADVWRLTPESFEEMVDWIYRKREVKEPSGPRVDLQKLIDTGIPFHMETDGLVLVSSEGMRRAREVGAVIEEGARMTDDPTTLERLVLAHRYLYYVLSDTAIGDYEYDRLEQRAKAVCPPGSPVHRVGSSLADDYSLDIKQLAMRLLGRRPTR